MKYLTTQAKDDPVEFAHGGVGQKYRLTTIQAALGCAQLELLDQYLAANRRIASAYAEAFSRVPGILPTPEASWARSAYWMYTVLVEEDEYGMNSRALMQRLAEEGIQTRPLWQPAHLSPAHRDAPSASCGIAEKLNHSALSLPCSVGLTTDQQQRVVATARLFQKSAPAGSFRSTSVAT